MAPVPTLKAEKEKKARHLLGMGAPARDETLHSRSNRIRKLDPRPHQWTYNRPIACRGLTATRSNVTNASANCTGCRLQC